VSEQIRNDTSAQLDYTVPVTSVVGICGKIRDRRQTKNRYTTKSQKLNTTQKKQTTQNTEKYRTSLVQSHLTTLGQETRWAYSTKLPSQHWVNMDVFSTGHRYKVTNRKGRSGNAHVHSLHVN